MLKLRNGLTVSHCVCLCVCVSICHWFEAVKYNPVKEEKEERESKQRKLQEIEDARKKAQEPKGECHAPRFVPDGRVCRKEGETTNMFVL